MKLIVLIITIVCLVGCSTNLSKGNNMMEAEQFDEAVHYYEKAMLDDPGDTEVATKLYEARTRMVMANLIKVRLQRQSNQNRAAAMQLNKSLHNIKRWKIIADSNVKATIEEEVLESGRWLDKELKSIAKRQDHNAFFYTLKQFNYILDAGFADNTINQHKPKLQKQGQQQCQNMKGQLSTQSYYLHGIWLDYCGVFAVEGDFRLSKDSTRFTQPNVLSSSLKIDKEAGISANQMAHQIENGIKDHPWFDQKGASPLSLELSGRVNYDLTSQPKTFSKTVMVVDETLELIKDPKDPKKVIRKLIHKKNVPKTTKFKGLEYTETFSYGVWLKGRVHSSNVDILKQAAKQTRLHQGHSAYFNEQGIRPLTPQFKNKQAWQTQIVSGLIKQARQDLDQAWIKQFCTDQNINKHLSKHEYAVRCSLYKPDSPIVNAWVQSEFALDFNQLMVMLGRK